MKTGMKIWVALFLAGSVIAGYGNGRNPAYPDEPGALRYRTDTARGRLWVLGLDYVRVYDALTKKLIRQINLPNWSVARFVCKPDMVIDSSGSAIVSSNAQARLLRIEASGFEVKEHEIRLQGREGWDVGFGALAYAADGTLFAVTSTGGSVWSVDIGKRSARMLVPAAVYSNTCELTPRLVNELERRHKR